MRESFLRKVLSTVFMGFAAACLMWVFRHVVAQSLYETGEGWRDMFHKKGQEERAR